MIDCISTPEDWLKGVMTPKDFRDKLGISPASLKRANKLLPSRQTINGKRYYLPEDLLNYYNLDPTGVPK